MCCTNFHMVIEFIIVIFGVRIQISRVLVSLSFYGRIPKKVEMILVKMIYEMNFSKST